MGGAGRALAAIAAVCAVAPGPAWAAPAGTLGHEGRWLTDGAGRVVVPRGFAVNDFKEPYLPEAAGFGANDARFLRRHGFDLVRVGFTWSGMEPRPGQIDRHYLDSLVGTVKLLARHGIRSLLDSHQDGYGVMVGTDGAPDWAVITDGVPNLRIQFGVDYFANPAVLRAFDNLYANTPAADGVGLADHYAEMWRVLARRLRDEPRVLGYELINEPYPGTSYPLCLNPLGCPAFDAKLSAFYRRIGAQIRSVDRTHLIFHEPNLFFDFGVDTKLDDPGGGDPRTGFAFHDYCLGAGAGDALPPIPGNELACPIEETLVMKNATRYAEKAGSALISTEWAATDDIEVTARVAAQLDEQMIPWTFWAYNQPRLVPDPKRPPKGSNLNEAALAVLDRPYPKVIAGTPKSWSWDPEGRVFELRYSTASPGTPRRAAVPSRVWTSPLHYPDGYSVRVSGATVAGPHDGRMLTLENRRGASEVRLELRPAGRSDRPQPRDPG